MYNNIYTYNSLLKSKIIFIKHLDSIIFYQTLEINLKRLLKCLNQPLRHHQLVHLRQIHQLGRLHQFQQPGLFNKESL